MYFQPGLKALVKFQKDRPKTVGVVRHGSYSLYSSVVLGSKMPKLKIRKRAKKEIISGYGKTHASLKYLLNFKRIGLKL